MGNLIYNVLAKFLEIQYGKSISIKTILSSPEKP